MSSSKENAGVAWPRSIFQEFISNVKRLLRGERAKPQERCPTCGKVLPPPGPSDWKEGGKRYHGAECYLYRRIPRAMGLPR